MHPLLHDHLRQLGIDPDAVTLQRDGILTFEVSGGKKGFDIWHALATHATSFKAWPVIVDFSDTSGNFKLFPKRLFPSSIPTVQSILDQVRDANPISLLIAAERQSRKMQLEACQQDPKLDQDMLPFLERDPADDILSHRQPAPAFSDWPATPPNRNAYPKSFLNYSGQPFSYCTLAILPTPRAWETPAYLRFGDYNECPPPHVHTAFLRDWHQRVKAVPIIVQHGVIELYIPYPLATPAEAWLFAGEQEDYCSDIISQVYGSKEKLAQALWQSSYWYLWWD